MSEELVDIVADFDDSMSIAMQEAVNEFSSDLIKKLNEASQFFNLSEPENVSPEIVVELCVEIIEKMMPYYTFETESKKESIR